MDMENYIYKTEYTPKKLIKTFVRRLTFRKKQSRPRHPVQTVGGNFSLTEICGCRFPGQQSAASGLCALLQSKCRSPVSWSPQVLDQILLQGDKLHTTCLHHLGRLTSGNGALRTQDLPTNFNSKHKKFSIVFTKEETLSSKSKPCHVTILLQSLKAHFLDNQDGILLTSGNTTVAVFIDDTYCYLFHPSKQNGNLSSCGQISLFPDRLFVFNATLCLMLIFLLYHPIVL